MGAAADESEQWRWGVWDVNGRWHSSVIYGVDAALVLPAFRLRLLFHSLGSHIPIVPFSSYYLLCSCWQLVAYESTLPTPPCTYSLMTWSQTEQN